MEGKQQEAPGLPDMDPDFLLHGELRKKPSVEDLQILSYRINDETTLES
jgi:hypothetical protein